MADIDAVMMRLDALSLTKDSDISSENTQIKSHDAGMAKLHALLTTGAHTAHKLSKYSTNLSQ